MTSTDSPDTTQESSFEPFSWFDHQSDTPTEKLAEASKDLGSGIALALQLIEASELEASDDTPLLNPRRRGELLRMAITSAQLLADLAQHNIERRNAASDAN